jgi:putative transposase
LCDRSRAPGSCPHRTGADVEAMIVSVRRAYGWGAKKLLRLLRQREPRRTWPARSTLNEILARNGLLKKHRRRPRWQHPGAAPLQTERPNQVWPADFKGQFRLGNARYCYPLTVTDHFSRQILVCHGLPTVTTRDAKPVFRALFRAVGLPEAIRTKQRRAVRVDGRAGPLRPECVVDATRDRASAHHAGVAAGKRDARTHAS